MRRWQLLAAWVVTVVAATAITWQIVSIADDRVGETDTAPLQLTTASTPSTAPIGSTSTTSPSGSTSAPSPSAPSSSSPSSTSPVPTTPELRTIPTEGGTLTVGVTPGSITYLSAVPATGFAVEVDDTGPPDVRVEFVSADTEVEVRVRWRDGQVDIEIDVDREN